MPALLGLAMFSSAGRDDSYITVWAAHALAFLGRIVNVNGEFVEQSSSLLHVLILAGLMKVTGMGGGMLAVPVSAVFGCVAVWLTHRLAGLTDRGTAPLAHWFVASAPALIYWSMGGLETTLVACTYTGVALAWSRIYTYPRGKYDEVFAFVAAAPFAIARPEAPLVLAAAVVTIWVILLVWRLRGKYEAGIAHAAGATWCLTQHVVFVTGVVLAGRRAYFGAWFPQPVSAKANGLDFRRALDGISYLATQGLAGEGGVLWGFTVLGIVVGGFRIFRNPSKHISLLVPLCLMTSGLLFVVASGGDWMEGARFLVPLLPFAAILADSTITTLAPRRSGVVVTLVVLFQLAGTLAFARWSSSGGPAWSAERRIHEGVSWFERKNRHHYRDSVLSEPLSDIISRLRQKKTGAVTVMTGQMGISAFRVGLSNYGHVRMIDMFGLTTRDFTSCPVTSDGTHAPAGLLVGYQFLFSHASELSRSCSLDLPDVIYDIDGIGVRAKLAQENRYHVVYRQDGVISNASHVFHGAIVPAGAFIAVRADLSAGLAEQVVHLQ